MADEPRRQRGRPRPGRPVAEPRRGRVDQRAHLSRVSGRPPLREYLAQLVERRHFITLQAWSQSTTQHRGMLLGNVWLVLSPLLDGLVYFVIFGLILQASLGMANFFGFLVIGVFMFSYTTRCLAGATGSIHSNRSLISAFTFPRAALPVAVVLRETFSMVPVALTLAVLLVAVPPHVPLTPFWLLAPFVFVLQALFNLGLALVVARIGAMLPDSRQLVPYVVRLWMYGSAVMFAVERFDAIPWLGVAVRANPLYQVLESYRTLLLDGAMPGQELWAAMTLWAFGTLAFGTVFFWQREVAYGRQ